MQWGCGKCSRGCAHVQEADVASFWEAMTAAVLQADMVSPLNSPKNPV